jgi:hypothetical protein
MGNTSYSHDDYISRSSAIRSSGYADSFTHDADVKSGKTATKVHPTMNPKGVKIRESRDSAAHPIALPIIIVNDLTGSMQNVPRILQREEPKLMGHFLDAKASGKRYIATAYPAIMIAGIDDYFAIGAEGALQIGQFESGIQIDENLSNLWLTGNGGGNHGESYDLALYFAARHTAHDHKEKRGKKGYLFIFGDEPVFSTVSAEAVQAVIGDALQADIPIAQIVKEASKLYHIFFAIPNGHQSTADVEGCKKLFGEERVSFFDPAKVCEYIVSHVAMIEGNAGVDDLIADGVVAEADRQALVKVGGSLATSGGVSLPPVAGKTQGVIRL